MRSNIRAQVQKNLQASEESQGTALPRLLWVLSGAIWDKMARRKLVAVCIAGPSSLQGPTPHFLPKGKEDELPPDAGVGLWGSLRCWNTFTTKAGLHAVWEQNKNAYMPLYLNPTGITNRWPRWFFDTEIYLKLASLGDIWGRTFHHLFLDFMGARPVRSMPGNYGSDYYVVIFPFPLARPHRGASLKMDQIRHTYLHYLLDPAGRETLQFHEASRSHCSGR